MTALAKRSMISEEEFEHEFLTSLKVHIAFSAIYMALTGVAIFMALSSRRRSGVRDMQWLLLMLAGLVSFFLAYLFYLIPIGNEYATYNDDDGSISWDPATYYAIFPTLTGFWYYIAEFCLAALFCETLGNFKKGRTAGFIGLVVLILLGLASFAVTSWANVEQYLAVVSPHRGSLYGGSPDALIEAQQDMQTANKVYLAFVVFALFYFTSFVGIVVAMARGAVRRSQAVVFALSIIFIDIHYIFSLTTTALSLDDSADSDKYATSPGMQAALNVVESGFVLATFFALAIIGTTRAQQYLYST